MTTELRNGEFIETDVRTFAPTFHGARPRPTVTQRSLRATRRANRAV